MIDLLLLVCFGLVLLVALGEGLPGLGWTAEQKEVIRDLALEDKNTLVVFRADW